MKLSAQEIYILKYLLIKCFNSKLDNYKLPSERFIVNKFKVTRSIIRKIYAHLLTNNLIFKEHGSGYYINKQRIFFMTSLKQELQADKIILQNNIDLPLKKFVQKFKFVNSNCTVQKNFYNHQNQIIGILISALHTKEHLQANYQYPQGPLVNELAKLGYLPFYFVKKRISVLQDQLLINHYQMNIVEIWMTKQYDENYQLFEQSIAIIDANHKNEQVVWKIL